jgi:transcriptional antiterminator Rof (Rho-off)
VACIANALLSTVQLCILINMSATEKVTVKNDRGEYFVIANEGMTQKWRKDKSIAAVDVVQVCTISILSAYDFAKSIAVLALSLI